MKYKINSTGNVIVADQAFVDAHYPGDYELIEEVSAHAPTAPRYISVGAFFDRFGADKWPILASTDPFVQALVKDCTVRIAQGINLDRPDVAGGVALLQSKGFASVTSAVITDPILESEKP